jgi:nucleoside triphosphate pyrophosphatase
MTTLNPRLYLASQSPRRAQLLGQIGIGFELISVDVDETPRCDEKKADYVERLAIAKASAGWDALECLHDVLPVLGADTSVVFDGKIMGKPKNRSDAQAMLNLLSGNTHQVMTGVCLQYQDLRYSTVTVTDVTFRTITTREMSDYWDSGEPQGKAGSYAIQGRAAIFVEQIHGSYSAVVGLPLAQTYQLLEQIEQEAGL